MPLLTKLINTVTSGRRREIDYFIKNPIEVQQKQLKYLLGNGAKTIFGQERGFDTITSGEQFAAKSELHTYESFSPYIDRTRRDEQGVVWTSEIKWFAKSSGTTGSNSKFIPVSREGLDMCHMKGPKDIACLISELYPDSNVYGGRTLTLGGSHRIEEIGSKISAGDLSAILIENTPFYARGKRIPKPETALIADFEEKVEAIYRETVNEDVTCFAGVPSWNLVMMNKILELSGKNNILEVWPNMEMFIHGGMNFNPYREQYKKIFPSENMKYMETYNASEGFFAIQNDPAADDMLLMLDYGVYYEFLPTQNLSDQSKAIPLEGVKAGVNYAMIITTCNGLWRYLIGDTVEFTSVFPYKIKITGRTKHFINAFGEELIIDNAESALKEACDMTGAHISDYTAAPIYMADKTKGSHQWVIEFSTPPKDPAEFTAVLDKALQKRNSDYEAKRFKDTTLLIPTITVVPAGTFYEWMKKRGKTGGQNKVPRLFNDRTYVDQLLP